MAGRNTNRKVKAVAAPEAPALAVNMDAPAKPTKVLHKLTAVQQKAVDTMGGPSDKIRFLTKEGLTRSQITQVITNAKGGKLLYQHVRNVQKDDERKAAEAKAKA